MKILIKTKVSQDLQTVWKGFDASLFLKLNPPGLPVTLRQFDGCQKGDAVKITLGKGGLSQDWNALIVDQKSSEQEIYFIDEGVKLPFFLKSWRHTHRLLRIAPKSTEIIDDITFTTPFVVTNYLLYPMLYFAMWWRKGVYRKVFRE